MTQIVSFFLCSNICGTITRRLLNGCTLNWNRVTRLLCSTTFDAFNVMHWPDKFKGKYLNIFSLNLFSSLFFHSLYTEFPSATFDSLVQLIHSGMNQQQRSDLLSALVTLEGEDDSTGGAAKTAGSTGSTTAPDSLTEVSLLDVCEQNIYSGTFHCRPTRPQPMETQTVQTNRLVVESKPSLNNPESP